jgi:PAS domain S-box-containing protein
MRQQLQYNKLYQSDRSNIVATTTQNTKKKQSIDTAPLPRTLEDALRPTKSRSIVITEANKPYRIVSVNTCWEQLCGYSSVESNGKTLGSLLRGPQTDPLAATTIIAKLLQGETDVGATLINYTKDKRPFYNRIRAGPIYNDHGQVTHFVGVLQALTAFQNNNNVSTIQQQMFM